MRVSLQGEVFLLWVPTDSCLLVLRQKFGVLGQLGQVI